MLENMDHGQITGLSLTDPQKVFDLVDQGILPQKLALYQL